MVIFISFSINLISLLKTYSKEKKEEKNLEAIEKETKMGGIG